MDVPAEAFDQARFIRRIYAVLTRLRKRVLQQFRAKSLRGLGKYHSLSRNSAGNKRDVFRQARSFHFLYGVHRGDAQNRRLTASGFFNYTRNLLGSYEWSDGVVYQHYLGVVGYFVQCRSHGILPRIASAHHPDFLFEIFGANPLLQPGNFVAARGYTNIWNLRAGRGSARAQYHDGRAIQLQRLLWSVGTHAGAHSGGG